jgi:glycerol dehydrogenase-like iron-containing ADH family enzyme
MFGFGDIVGNIVTASELASLSDQDLAKGFEQMARDTARSIARTLEDDLYSARFGD